MFNKHVQQALTRWARCDKAASTEVNVSCDAGATVQAELDRRGAHGGAVITGLELSPGNWCGPTMKR